ncbi:hypothetical protein [Pedobacter sp. B4-66]|uniref:hypothetical protein n=1 Tax=Pedobacter sp. B4-66 TaxID=2817280 RepID=UPI001BD9BD06|nr:hypothetical protein [Pedobacter sp. B4-66]
MEVKQILLRHAKKQVTSYLHILVITNGITEKEMPAWNGTSSTENISKLADFINERSKK